MNIPGFRGEWFTIGEQAPADGEGGRIEKAPVERTELESERPLLFLAARTDTWVFQTPRMTSMGQEKMSKPLAPSADQVTIGIDISKDRLDVHVHPEGGIQQFTNDRAGHARLIAWIAPKQPARIIFEATGAYHRALHQALTKAALPGVRINPWQARRFAEATGRRVKTDPVDAALLARLGATLQPDIPPAREATTDTLAELLAPSFACSVARRALIKDRTAALNRGKNLTLPLLKCQNQQQIEAQIKAIDSEQAALVAKQQRLKARFDILLSIPGLGAVSALAMLIDMPELGSIENKQAASLGGLAPITRQSGSWRGKSFIRGGRAQLRQALYMPALVAIRFNSTAEGEIPGSAQGRQTRQGRHRRRHAQTDRPRQRAAARQPHVDRGADQRMTQTPDIVTPFSGSAEGPFSHPGHSFDRNRAQSPSRLAAGHRNATRP
jgi:transposase